MKEYARIHHHVYLDYFSAMSDDKGFLKDALSDDGLHPNQQGYVVMAPLAEVAIAASLKRGNSSKNKKSVDTFAAQEYMFRV